jgi:hypothetical protein
MIAPAWLLSINRGFQNAPLWSWHFVDSVIGQEGTPL